MCREPGFRRAGRRAARAPQARRAPRRAGLARGGMPGVFFPGNLRLFQEVFGFRSVHVLCVESRESPVAEPSSPASVSAIQTREGRRDSRSVRAARCEKTNSRKAGRFRGKTLPLHFADRPVSRPISPRPPARRSAHRCIVGQSDSPTSSPLPPSCPRP